LLETLASQEEPFVGVNDLTDYLRCGNVKISDQLMKLPVQEQSQIFTLLFELRLTMEVLGQQIMGNSSEVACTEKWIAKIWGDGYFQNIRKKGLKQVLEGSDGVLGFSKTKFSFEQKKVDQKLENGHAEQLFG
jgi:hypothetical protein